MENKGCCPVQSTEKSGSCGTDKSSCCCTSKCGNCWWSLTKGTLVGGIALFAIMMASWMVLPYHKQDMLSFKNEKAVAAAIDANAEKSGIYILPNTMAAMEAAKTEAAPAKGKKAAAAEEVTKPYAFVSVFKAGVDMKTAFKAMAVKDLLVCFLAAFLLTCLLKKMGCCCCPVMGSFKIGLLIAVLAYLPNLIWYNFPLDYVLLGMVDTIVAVTVAGYLISKVSMKRKTCQ